jgi:hypothetical protein
VEALCIFLSQISIHCARKYQSSRLKFITRNKSRIQDIQRAHRYLRMAMASQGSKIAKESKDDNYLTINYIGPVALDGQRDGFEAGGGYGRGWAPTALSLSVGGCGTFRYSPGGVNCP